MTGEALRWMRRRSPVPSRPMRSRSRSQRGQGASSHALDWTLGNPSLVVPIAGRSPRVIAEAERKEVYLSLRFHCTYASGPPPNAWAVVYGAQGETILARSLPIGPETEPRAKPVAYLGMQIESGASDQRSSRSTVLAVDPAGRRLRPVSKWETSSSS